MTTVRLSEVIFQTTFKMEFSFVLVSANPWEKYASLYQLFAELSAIWYSVCYTLGLWNAAWYCWTAESNSDRSLNVQAAKTTQQAQQSLSKAVSLDTAQFITLATQ